MARPRAPTRKTEEAVDRRQNNRNVKALSPRQSPATSVLRSCCFSCCAGKSHKDNVCCTAVDRVTTWSKKEAQLSLPSSTSELLISSGLTWGSNTTSLLLISPLPAKVSNFFLRVQLTSLLLISPGLWYIRESDEPVYKRGCCTPGEQSIDDSPHPSPPPLRLYL